MTEEEFKNLKHKTLVINKEGYYGHTMPLKDWIKENYEASRHKYSFEYYSKGEDYVYVKYNKLSPCGFGYTTYNYYDIVINEQPSCNHKYILMLNNRVCEYCGKEEL